MAARILELLRAGKVSFADINGADVVELTVNVPKRIPNEGRFDNGPAAGDFR